MAKDEVTLTLTIDSSDEKGRGGFDWLREFCATFSEQQAGILRPWAEDAAFCKLASSVKGITLLDAKRLYMLAQIASGACKLEGDIAETGVYKGGSALFIAQVLNRANAAKRLFLFDSFEGMPETDAALDSYQHGDFGDTSVESVKRLFKPYRNVEICKGMFDDTFSQVRNRAFAMVHIDCDLYASVRLSTQFFYPRLAAGGFLLYDDYGAKIFSGARYAVDEYFAARLETPLYLPTGQCLVTKVSTPILNPPLLHPSSQS